MVTLEPKVVGNLIQSKLRQQHVISNFTYKQGPYMLYLSAKKKQAIAKLYLFFFAHHPQFIDFKVGIFDY